jgi:hypothetical protein
MNGSFHRTWADRLWDLALVIVALFALAVALTGCNATLPVLPARTAIPVECKEPKPERPAMPTANLTAESSLDASVQAMQAEIALRDGYEDQLVTALAACTAPIKR